MTPLQRARLFERFRANFEIFEPAIEIDNAGDRLALVNLHVDDRIALAAGNGLGPGLLREVAMERLVGDPGPSNRIAFFLGRQRAEQGS